MIRRGYHNHLVLVGLLLLGSTLAACQRQPELVTAHGRPVSQWLVAIKDRDPKVRKRAIAALQSVGRIDPAAIPALTEALKDKDAKVRDAAVIALLNIGPEAQDIAEALRGAANDKDAQVRAHVAAALARVGKK